MDVIHVRLLVETQQGVVRESGQIHSNIPGLQLGGGCVLQAYRRHHYFTALTQLQLPDMTQEGLVLNPPPPIVPQYTI